MQDIRISIIMPCFNHGVYLGEAIQSVTKGNYPFGFEIIIIDDGSTDDFTKQTLKSISDQRITVIHQENAGPSVARNTGIRQARGKYLLPLDSDNKIDPNYLIKGVALLDNSPELDIVHSKGGRFGGKSETTEVGGSALKIREIVQFNNIDTCAIFRKSVWERVGGYDEYLSKKGLEDWEFWLSCVEQNKKFLYLDEILYYHREAESSRTFQVANKNMDEVVDYVRKKHTKFIIETLEGYRYDYNNLLRTPEYRLGSFLLKPVRWFSALLGGKGLP